MKRACSVLALVMFGVLLASAPAYPQACSIGGHNETSENFAPGGWAIPNMSPGTLVGAPTGSHLVFTEIGCRGAGTGAGSDSSEYVEIYNPTTKAVSLDHMYISDDTQYYRIVNGTYVVAQTSDFALRFPGNLSLLPGRTLVLCVTKAGFAGSGASAAGAQYFLEMRDSNANPLDDMIIMTPNSVFPVTGGMMTNPSSTNGEWVVLYCWNGSSDLVCDVDYASWGANSASNPKMDKTGVSVDGPDADAVASAYNPDIAAALQTNLGSGTVLTKPNTYQRVAGEVGEAVAGGNGCRDRVVPTVIDWAPLAGTRDIRFHIRWENQDPDNMSDPINGSMMSQEFGVFLPNMGSIGNFTVPPLQPNSFFDVFFDISLDLLPPPPQKILPGGGPGASAANASFEARAQKVTADCPPDTNWAGNVDIVWSGPGQGGQVGKHYADLLTCAGGPPSYIHFRGSNCPVPMPWSVVGVCPGFTVTLVNEDFTPAPNPVPVGWTGWICVSAAAAVPSGTNCCFGIAFQCAGSTSVIDICSTACDWQTRPPVLTQIDWVNVGTNVRFHQRWENQGTAGSTDPLTGNMSSQKFGVFLPDFGPIGSFAVPPIAPSSFFDVFIDIPLTSLPPEPNTVLPGGGTVADLPCPPPTAWHGNVDIIWASGGGTGQANKHFGEMPICPGAGPTYLHVETGCNSPLGGLQWSISGLCPGFNATLVNGDLTPAPNPLPPNWIGFICVSAPATTPVGTLCCFKVDFLCPPDVASIEVCARTCDWRRKPVLAAVDWTNLGTNVRFHQRWQNPSSSGPSEPVDGSMSSQMFGAFLPNSGPIGSFNVPPIAPNSFFDVFFDVSVTDLPPEPNKELPAGGPTGTTPCPPPNVWNGNVDVEWSGAGGTGNANYHFADLPVCPGAGPSYVHFILACPSPLGVQWTINGLCPGFGATLVNEDKSPAPNPLPAGWTGWICVQVPAGMPIGTTCCFTVDLLCDGVPAQVQVCARVCDWRARQPVLAAVDWTNIGTDVRFHQRWTNPNPTGDSEPVSGTMSSQMFGAFLPNAGPIGSFNVPPIAPNSFFDVFFDVPMANLPPEPPKQLPGGGPGGTTPCPPPGVWNGNVDVEWTGSSGTAGNANYHFTDFPVCPGAGPSYVHFILACPSPLGVTWAINGLCPGFSATLVNEDKTPAPNPLPPGWTGWICVQVPAGMPIGTTCCFTVDLLCDGVPAQVQVCARVCDWRARPPVLRDTDWTRVGPNVRFHMSWENPDGTGDSGPVSGNMMSQPLGAFLQNSGPIGTFNVPPIPPNSFFDVFIEIPMSQLPPEPQKMLPGGGPPPTSPCPPDTSWSGNVDIVWSGIGGTGQVNRHFAELLVRPGVGSSHVHALIFCGSAAGSPWSITGLCPGWTATLLNEDFTPAPNPVPPNWTGWISVAAAAGVPAGASCCFDVTFLCDGVPGVIEVCATACEWPVAGVISNPANLDFGILRTVPNPATTAMVIDFVLPRAGHASVQVYDLAGKLVGTLFDGESEAGARSVRWEGRDASGRRLAPGTYFVKLQAAGRATSKKVVLFH